MKIGIATSIAAALFILVATLVLRELVHAGMLDGSVGTRAMMVTNGVIVALCGNLVPKTLAAPRASFAAERRMQAALRSAGLVMTLAGVTYALLWLAAPEAIAQPLSLGALGLAFLYTVYRILRCKWGRADLTA